MSKLYEQPEQPLSKVKISELLGSETGALA